MTGRLTLRSPRTQHDPWFCNRGVPCARSLSWGARRHSTPMGIDLRQEDERGERLAELPDPKSSCPAISAASRGDRVPVFAVLLTQQAIRFQSGDYSSLSGSLRGDGPEAKYEPQ